MSNLVVHFEIHASDPQRLIDFYGQLLGWTFENYAGGDQPYWVIDTGEGAIGNVAGEKGLGINGGLTPRMGPAPEIGAPVAGCNIVIGVDDVDGLMAHVILCSSVVWLWSWDATGIDGFLGSNTYVWICLGLLIALPLREGAAAARPLPHPAGSATMGACAHATEYPWESRQSARPASPTPPASKPAPFASDG